MATTTDKHAIIAILCKRWVPKIAKQMKQYLFSKSNGILICFLGFEFRCAMKQVYGISQTTTCSEKEATPTRPNPYAEYKTY